MKKILIALLFAGSISCKNFFVFAENFNQGYLKDLLTSYANDLPVQHFEGIDLGDETLAKRGMTRPITSAFYMGVPITNASIDPNSATAGRRLTQANTYYISSEIVRPMTASIPFISIENSDVTLDLNSRGLNGTSGGTVTNGITIQAGGYKNITIKNGSIKNMNYNGIFIGNKTRDVTIENVTIIGCKDNAIEVNGGSGSEVKNLTLRNVKCLQGTGTNEASQYAIGFQASYLLGGSLVDCEISNNVSATSDKYGYGVKMNNSKSIVFDGCTLTGNAGEGTGYSAAFYLDTCAACTFADCLVTETGSSSNSGGAYGYCLVNNANSI